MASGANSSDSAVTERGGVSMMMTSTVDRNTEMIWAVVRARSPGVPCPPETSRNCKLATDVSATHRSGEVLPLPLSVTDGVGAPP